MKSVIGKKETVFVVIVSEEENSPECNESFESSYEDSRLELLRCLIVETLYRKNEANSDTDYN